MHRLKLLAGHLGRVLLNSGVADAALIGAASTNDPACGKPSVKLTLGISTSQLRMLIPQALIWFNQNS